MIGQTDFTSEGATPVSATVVSNPWFMDFGKISFFEMVKHLF